MNNAEINFIELSGPKSSSAYSRNLNMCDDHWPRENCTPPKDLSLYKHQPPSNSLPEYAMPSNSPFHTSIDGECYQDTGRRSKSSDQKSFLGSFDGCSDCSSKITLLPAKHQQNLFSESLNPLVQKYTLRSNISGRSEKWISSSKNNVFGLINQSLNFKNSNTKFYLVDQDDEIVAESFFYKNHDYDFRFEFEFKQHQSYKIVAKNLDQKPELVNKNISFPLPGQTINILI